MLSDGQLLLDKDRLDGPADIQLILQPFAKSTEEQIKELCSAARSFNIPNLEQIW